MTHYGATTKAQLEMAMDTIRMLEALLDEQDDEIESLKYDRDVLRDDLALALDAARKLGKAFLTALETK